jgi:O-antigen/teichoic acid export membrane protein
MVEPRIRRPGVAASGGVLGPAALVSVAFLGANALAYVFTVLAARSLAPAAYGELAALLGLLLVGTVPATGLQTAAALHLGRRDSAADPAAVGRWHATALTGGLTVAALAVLAAPLIGRLLHVTDAATLFWLAALLLPHTLVAGYQGLLQGTRRHARLAVVAAVFATGKLAGGTAGLLIGGSPTATLAGMTAGASAGALAGWAATGRPGLNGTLGTPLRASLSASATLLGFVVLLNLDVLLARHHLPAGQSGEYAVGAIVAKVAFWLPQGVGVVLLPRLADPEHRRRLLTTGLMLVGSVGLCLVLATAVLGAAALPFVGGSAYGGSLGSAAWLFAALGTLLAIAQLLLFSGMAAADRGATAAVWLAALAEMLLVELLSWTGRLTPLTLVTGASVVAALLVGTGLARRHHP